MKSKTLARFSPSTGAVMPVSVYRSFPPDAVDIPDDVYRAFQDGEIGGFAVEGGVVVGVQTPCGADDDTPLSRIAAIEATITPRRLREAVLGLDNGWLADVNEKISELRKQL